MKRLKLKIILAGLAGVLLNFGFAFGVTLAQIPGISRLPTGVECRIGQECTSGPYKIKATFDRDGLNTIDQFMLKVERLDGKSADWQLHVEALPAPKTSATPVKFKGNFENGTTDIREVKIAFPISGAWFVQVSLKGSVGTGEFRVPVQAAPPPKLDDWLAWTIGLSPLLGVAGFAIGQWRYVLQNGQSQRVEEKQARAGA